MDLPQIITDYAANLWAVLVEAAPWLMFGLVAAGLIKAFIPPDWMARWLGRRGAGSVLRAALIGMPLPLCSCGVLPAALGVRRAGASKGATISFLIATPQNGADSVALSYALLGPFLMIARPIASLVSAIFAGLLTEISDSTKNRATLDSSPTADSCCCSDDNEKSTDLQNPDTEESDLFTKDLSPLARTMHGLRYSVTSILDDIVLWLAVGLMLAAVVDTFVPRDALATWGSGLPAMLVMMAVGVPMYICATASTPVAAAMLLAGISPGTVLVFLLAGPATNLGTVAVVRKELGTAALGAYLLGIGIGSIVCGLIADAVVGAWSIDVTGQVAHSHEMLPGWFSIACAVMLVFFSIKPLRRLVMRG